MLTDPLEQFIDDDVENIIELFKVNSGTHGEAASISFPSLVATKTRVEDGIVYLSRVFRLNLTLRRNSLARPCARAEPRLALDAVVAFFVPAIDG